VPVILIVPSSVPLGRAAKLAGTTVLFGLSIAELYGLLGFAMSGYVGLVGECALAVLLIGWIALLAVALFCGKAVSREV
jgi:hypothetical protein